MGRRPRVPAIVTRIMRESDRHAWTLGQLASALAKEGDHADFSTIFRSMERLQDDGVVGRVELADGQARFELEVEHHDHLYCTSCGDLTPLPCKVVQTTLSRAEQTTGFTAHGHYLVITGTCSDCGTHPGSGDAGPSASRAGR